MEKRSVHGIGQVFKNQDPIGLPLRFTDETAVRVIFQFFRDYERRYGLLRLPGEVNPYETRTFLSRELIKTQPWCEFCFGNLACRNGYALACRVIAPSVVRASQRVVQNLSHAELGTTVQAPVLVGMDFVVGIAPQNDVESQPVQADRSFLNPRRLTDRVPHIPEPKPKIRFEFDLFFRAHNQ
jgi:hypothetical protein